MPPATAAGSQAGWARTSAAYAMRKSPATGTTPLTAGAGLLINHECGQTPASICFTSATTGMTAFSSARAWSIWSYA
jgi:hypothetical protein